MMRKISIPMFVFFAVMISGCASRTVHGSGNVTSETRSVRNFERVDICCGMELYLEQGKAERLEIEAEDNILEEIVSDVVAGTLKIEYKNQYPDTAYFPSRPIRVYLSVVDIERIEISGGGELSADSLESERLQINLSGGSDAQIDDLVADSLDVDVSGGGDVEIAGQVGEQYINASGGSSYDAEDLHSEKTTLNLSGGGQARLWVQNTLNVDASGGSQVRYYGSPSVNSDASGGSEIRSLGEHD
jgi:hypothetical protein